MAEKNTKHTEPFTRNVYVFKNWGRPSKPGHRPGWWQKEGGARTEPDGEIFGFLHSTPLGSYDGCLRIIDHKMLPHPAPDWLDASIDEGDIQAKFPTEQNTSKPFTHNVYIFKAWGRPNRSGQRPGWWQREGVACFGPNDEMFVFLHSTPTGGFDGRLRIIDINMKQPELPAWIEADFEDGDAQPEGDDKGAEIE